MQLWADHFKALVAAKGSISDHLPAELCRTLVRLGFDVAACWLKGSSDWRFDAVLGFNLNAEGAVKHGCDSFALDAFSITRVSGEQSR